MSIIEAIVLGVVQGLTEFLPVSSSGHLVIFQHLFGIEEPSLTFDVILHLGTLVAVFIVFWNDIATIIQKPFSKFTYLIIMGTIPAALAGFFLSSYVEQAFTSLLVVGLGLLFTGAVLKYSEYLSAQRFALKRIDEMDYKDTFFIGIIQALAIFPGISRSGSTIAAGLIAGLEREFAARFSFVLAIPVMLGAGAVHVHDLFKGDVTFQYITPLIIGFLVAALSGYFAIKVVLELVRHGKLAIFSWYCWAIGIIVLVVHFKF